jgi:hypothetical protein
VDGEGTETGGFAAGDGAREVGDLAGGEVVGGDFVGEDAGEDAGDCAIVEHTNIAASSTRIAATERAILERDFFFFFLRVLMDFVEEEKVRDLRKTKKVGVFIGGI